MRLTRLLYLPLTLFWVILFMLTFEPVGNRLPFYFALDGSIITPDDRKLTFGRELIAVDGVPPDKVATYFETKNTVVVQSDTGIHLVDLRTAKLIDYVYDFRYLIFLSFLFLLIGIWFWDYGNDLYLSSFCFVVALFLYSTVAMLVTQHYQLQLLWHLSYFLLIPTILNLALRSTGKEISGHLLLGESIVVLFLALVAYAGAGNVESFLNITLFCHFLISIAILILFVTQFENATRSSRDPVELMKRWSLVISSGSGIALPLLLLSFNHYFELPLQSRLTAFLLTLTAPLLLLYGTYRIHLIPVQLVLSRSILYAFLLAFLIILYATALLTHSMLLPTQNREEQWIVHLIFIFTLVFFLDPLRRRFSRFIAKHFFRLRSRHTESLQQMASIISMPTRIQSAMNSIVHELQEQLDCDRVIFLVEENSFPGLSLKSGRVLRLPRESTLWRHVAPGHITVTSYLTYGGGSRSEMYRLLSQNKIYLAIGITGTPIPIRRRRLKRLLAWALPEQLFDRWVEGGAADGRSSSALLRRDSEVQSAILIGEKRNQSKYRLSEIRFLQEAGRLTSLLVNNYTLLLAELDRRRQMNRLEQAGEIQRLLDDSPEKIPNLNLSWFSLPAATVSGDYLDLIQLPESQVVVVIGDVTGHGLGTGYLVNAIRSLIRSHLLHSASLPNTLEALNHFVMERCRGSDYVTLILLRIDTISGEIEYINAAHSGPYLQERGSASLTQLSDSQRLPGISLAPYSISRITLEPGQRLFLYSDGVTETFDRNDQPFGDRRLQELLQRYHNQPLSKISEELGAELWTFRDEQPLQDDTTFIGLEFAAANRS